MVEGERRCLEYLAIHSRPHGEMCIAFRPIQEATGYDRAKVRRHVRALARKGLAEYHCALWTEDGTPAGAGYCITEAGIAADEAEAK